MAGATVQDQRPRRATRRGSRRVQRADERPLRAHKPPQDAPEAPREAPGAPQEPQPHGARSVLTRISLGILTTLISVNIWTGGPLVALWVGSRIQTAVGQLSMAAVGATIGVLIVETFLLYKALAYLTAAYNQVLGRVVPRRQAAWLKPMSGERRAIEVRRPLSAPERIVVTSVVAAVLVFEVWFFFFAHYSFPA